MVAVDLLAHPHTQSHAVRRVRVAVARTAPAALALRYGIEADLARLRIPAPRPPAVAERLWQHTCCEAFVARPGEASYREFNFSPSGEWAAYEFRNYRDRASCSAVDPQIALRRSSDALELEARIPVPPGRLRVALCVVIEDRDSALSYWALRHPAEKPDFHHPEGFALELE